MNTSSFSCFVYQSLNLCVPEPSLMCFPRHFRFLFPNSMNTESFDFYLQTRCTKLNFSKTDPIHRYQMNIVGLLLFCLNGTIWKNMDLCVAFATYFYLFCVPCLSSFLYVFIYVLLAKNNVHYYD
ncbi:hypothetical protein GLYMA_12G175901v4 [Glycine max]|nr:hypothetical protein GLYMA_12G175901v4 [Glycine max]KAG4385856.1 hypothetical protein GLYMA_12G175901v4 [Glycine max]KAH1143666.1 hypothetical protein GYH30_034080 [Glycine max]KAH1143668.1 hypothetical protein GYH30_034080 [Glycine max]